MDYVVGAGLVVIAVPIIAVAAVTSGVRAIPTVMIHTYDYFNPSLIDARLASVEKKLQRYQSVRSKETISNWYVTKAQYNLLKNDVVLATQDLQEAITADGANFNAYYYLGYVHLTRGAYKEAVQQLDMALEMYGKRPVEGTMKQTFHSVEKKLSSWKVDLLGAKDMLSSAITFGTVHKHVEEVAESNDKMRERIKALEIKQVSHDKVLNARAVANYMQGYYIKAIPDLQNLLQDPNVKPSLARMRYMYSLACAHFFAQQWNECNTQIASILQFKGLPSKYTSSLQMASQYCQYKQGQQCDASVFPMYMRFLPDDMLQCVFAYFDQETVVKYLQVSLFFAPLMPKFEIPETDDPESKINPVLLSILKAIAQK